jgi:Ser/Thr protein kinase RdoA (MazF antagonist)
VYLEEGAPVVVKFYRPGRWSREQIDEEHAFARELAEREIPVVAPTQCSVFGPFIFAVYPRRGGRAPNLEDPKVLEWIGRFLGRIHAVGATVPFRHRETLDSRTFGHEPSRWLIEHRCVPEDLFPSWKAVIDQGLEAIDACYARAGGVKPIRLHGDCHPGNILWTDHGEMSGPHFVDLDDARMGPAVQDLWMLLSGERDAMAKQLHHVLAGYEEFMDFDRRELHLVEALRTLRLIHYAYWIARRWDDPAFPAAFPWFGTQRYWQDRILELKEQVALMHEEPIRPS